MGTVERGAIIAGMMWEVGRLTGCHQTLAEIAGRLSPCRLPPVELLAEHALDDDEEPTAGINAPQDIHPLY